jgi:hypothetical protein
MKGKLAYFLSSRNWLFLFLLCIFLPRAFAQIAPGNTIKIGSLGISSIAYSRDNKMMAVASLKKVDILVTGGNSVNNSIQCKVGEINDIAFSGDGSKIIVAGKKNFGNAVQVYDAKIGNLILSIPVSGNLLSVDASRDNKYIAVTSFNKKLYVFQMADGKKMFELTDNKGRFTDVLFNRKSNAVYVSSTSGHFYEVNLQNGSYTKELLVMDGLIRTMAISHDNRFVACGFDNGIVKLVEVPNNYALYHLPGSQTRIYSLSFSEDDKYLCGSSYSPQVAVWSLDLMALKRVYDLPFARGTLAAVAFDPGCKWLFTADYKRKKLYGYDVSDLNIMPKSILRNDKDINPPQINIQSPALTGIETKVFSENIYLKGAAIDETGIFSLKLNGSQVQLSNGNEFNLPIKLAMGENQFVIEATDVNDMSTVKKFTIIREDETALDLDIDYSSKNYLLVFGIDQYAVWPKLNNAVSDAIAIAEVLKKKYNFKAENTRVLFNEQATKQAMIDEFKNIIEKIGPNDHLLIYFSGHGFYDQVLNEGYWIPQDAKRDVDADYLPNSYLVKMLKQISAKHVFIIADACFSGSLFIDSERGNLDNAAQAKSRWALTSGRLEYVDDGQSGGHSPFAKAVLDYLDNNIKSRSTAFEMINFVREKVSEESKQVPIGNVIKNAGDEGGEFIFDLFGN